VVFALLHAGAARVAVWNRHPERAAALVSDFSDAAGAAELVAAASPSLDNMDILVNATSVGMVRSGPDPNTRGDPDPIKELRQLADELSDRLIVVDLVYRQDRTPLVRAAQARGLRCADGIDVLVHQGAASFRLWTGMHAPLGAMRSGATDGTD
jgi:shikimate dehydrogenase